jgi:hypothetical protein
MHAINAPVNQLPKGFENADLASPFRRIDAVFDWLNRMPPYRDGLAWTMRLTDQDIMGDVHTNIAIRLLFVPIIPTFTGKVI